MKELALNNIYKYLESFNNSSIINKEIINLSNKIERFCFKCDRDHGLIDSVNLYLNDSMDDIVVSECNDFINYDMNLDTNDEYEEVHFNKIRDFNEEIDYNPSSYVDHDILNKYLYLSDYLENSCDKDTAVLYLNNIVNLKQLTNANIVEKSSLDRGLLSRILNNKSEVTKDSAIKLCFGLSLNYDESLELLLRFGYTLSALSKRDCIIRYGIDNHLAIDEIDYILEELDEEVLINK